jgi:hypothetical protein
MDCHLVLSLCLWACCWPPANRMLCLAQYWMVWWRVSYCEFVLRQPEDKDGNHSQLRTWSKLYAFDTDVKRAFFVISFFFWSTFAFVAVWTLRTWNNANAGLANIENCSWWHLQRSDYANEMKYHCLYEEIVDMVSLLSWSLYVGLFGIWYSSIWFWFSMETDSLREVIL